jgi:TonB-linked SusC/RagA family outer membrane protein
MKEHAMRKLGWLLAFLALLTTAARPVAAQETGTIQGTVTDAQGGSPVVGARVTVDGTSIGAATGADGRFVLRNVPAGTRTLRAAMLGYASAQRTVAVTAGATATANFSLAETGVLMDELVVTALGIPREKREISTSVQEVRGEDLARTNETNLVAALSGKVSGVTITNSNSPGGSSRIVIRGANSLTGNNQPLFVVDGVPVSNSAPGYTGGTCGGCTGFNAIDYGNIIQDLNPNDIESISVLKGPNAAALYGSRASNGAVIITTKSGRGGTGGVTASSQVTFETPLMLPRYQNLYGQGFNGRFSYVDGAGSGTFDDTDESWGPRLDAGLMIPQFFSNGQPAPWVSHPDNVRDFFETGRTVNTSAAFTYARQGSNLRLSVANLDQDGMFPGFQMTRTTAGLNGNAELSSRLTADASVQYINSDAKNRPAQGYGEDNVMWQFIWFGRQVDTNLLRRMRNDDGSQYHWNYAWNNNPFWTSLVNGNADTRDRLIGSASLAYELAPWLTGMVRSGTDWYEENRTRTYQAGTIGRSATGGFTESTIFEKETNTEFLLTARMPQRGRFEATANFGGSRRDNRGRLKGASVDSLVVPGLFNLGNRAVDAGLTDRRSAQRVNSLLGSAQLAFDEMWFVDVTGRNDWSSTLPENSRSYFYPSVSTSLIFTQLADVPFLSYGKLRAGWSEVGNDQEPYNLVDPYISDEFFNNNPRLTGSNLLRNPDLKPERTRSWEVGTELRGPGDRLGLELTYYNETTRNQIVPVQVTPQTGVTERMLNAGQVSNRGIELLLDATPVRLANGLEWNVSANYTRNRSNVDALYGDLQSLVLGTFYNTSVQARPGQPYGVIYGRKYVRDSQGRIVVGSTGLPLTTGPIERLGKYDPDWTGGLNSRLSFRGADLSVSVDGRFGGSIFSMTNMHGRRSGVLYESLLGRENANDTAFVVPGVRVVNGDTVPNDIKITAQRYHKSISQTSSPISEEWVYDASFVKLREVRLGYAIPGSFTRRMGVSGLSLALVGRNLALWSEAPNIDPETAFNASNVQGFEYGQLPSARSVGFNITVTP